MDISSISPTMSKTNIKSDVGIKMLDNSLKDFQQQGQQMTKMMEQSVNPGIGSRFDMSI